MTDLIKKCYIRYRDLILYVFFGGLTTAVNFVVYFVCARMLPVTATTIPTVIAWILAVLFAYGTNRTWVFRSKTRGKAAGKEFTAFLTARIASGVMDVVIMYVLVDMLGFHDALIKLLSNVIVMIVNYILSKFFIFKKPA